MKSTTFSGTTDASGNVRLYTGADRMVIGAKDSISSAYAIWMNGNTKYAKVYTTASDGKLQVKPNTAVSGIYYYLEM